MHHLLGNIYDDARHISADPALPEESARHYQAYIALTTKIGDLADAAKGCREMARLKLSNGELDHALIFAEEAVHKCESLGEADPQGLVLSRGLVRHIDAVRQARAGGPS